MQKLDFGVTRKSGRTNFSVELPSRVKDPAKTLDRMSLNQAIFTLAIRSFRLVAIFPHLFVAINS